MDFLAIRFSPRLLRTELVQSCALLEGLDLAPLDSAEPLTPGVPVLYLLVPGESAPEQAGIDSYVCVLGEAADGEPGEVQGTWLRIGSSSSLETFVNLTRTRWPFIPVAMAFARLRQEFDAQALVLDQLTEVSLALSSEHNYRRLLSLILSRALLLAGCDAGSLYLTIPEEEGPPTRLLFAAVQNDSKPIPFEETELWISKSSLAGYVAATGETLVIDDSYTIPSDAHYRFNRAYDEQAGYRTKSQLIIPMLNQKGDITGVLQLINKKRNPSALLASPEEVEAEVIPFDAATRGLMKTVGSLAAVAIDNNRLYQSIEGLFEGFVRASVTAIEQRDPTTSGHSMRVSVLTVDLAEKAVRVERGPLAGLRFTPEQLREIRYAALLHDFGKVGVRENVLVKAKKLYPFDLERVLTRLETARLCAERDLLMRQVERHMAGAVRPQEMEAFARDLRETTAKLDRFQEVVLRADEPTVLPEGDFSALKEIAAASFTDRMGRGRALLEPEEMAVLSIRKGSLSEEERLEIESHVTHTFHFLKQIPWTSELRDIPEIAYAHHEKLNGRGYPRGVTAPVIPVQSRMMTVADIFDALSASDRPYKRAVPVDRALDILRDEAGAGLLDPALVDLFIEGKVYETTRHLSNVALGS
ncbi:MAG: HD domain-containing phosphohydrolase [Acidobacteriota bacterium]